MKKEHITVVALIALFLIGLALLSFYVKDNVENLSKDIVGVETTLDAEDQTEKKDYSVSAMGSLSYTDETGEYRVIVVSENCDYESEYPEPCMYSVAVEYKKNGDENVRRSNILQIIARVPSFIEIETIGNRALLKSEYAFSAIPNYQLFEYNAETNNFFLRKHFIYSSLPNNDIEPYNERLVEILPNGEGYISKIWTNKGDESIIETVWSDL